MSIHPTPSVPGLRPQPEDAALAHYPSLRGRRVFITGGGSGIGAALVEAFALQAARVAFVDVAQQPSTALCRNLHGRGLGRPWWRACDVRDIAALQSAIADAAAALGDFDVLVNNVASDQRHRLEDVDADDYMARVAVNERPAFFAIQAVLPAMRARRAGAIINLGSTGWQAKVGDYPCYAVAKASVNGLTRGLARNLGREGIRINTVSPGWVMTPRQIAQHLDAAGEEEIRRNQCLPGKLMPHDIAAMVLFLASDDGQMCTAQEFVVDAGWL